MLTSEKKAELRTEFLKLYNGMALVSAYERGYINGNLRQDGAYTVPMYVIIGHNGFVVGPDSKEDERTRDLVGKRTPVSDKNFYLTIGRLRSILIDPLGNSAEMVTGRVKAAEAYMASVRQRILAWRDDGSALGGLKIDGFEVDAYSSTDADEMQVFLQNETKSGMTGEQRLAALDGFELTHIEYMKWYKTKRDARPPSVKVDVELEE